MYPVYIKNYGLFKLSFNKFNNYFLGVGVGVGVIIGDLLSSLILLSFCVRLGIFMWNLGLCLC